MRNWKKVFALVLTCAMAFGFSAGAFTDSKDIVNTKAVNTISAVGIIKGYTDGSFNPTRTVTRAEMAKMIYVLKNGGKDDGATYYAGIKTNLSDIKGHWAEGYINYCFTLGIIAGMGDGTFRPDDSVTGLQAAKMLLVVIGYTANEAGLLGPSWNLKTAALASEKGLFEDYAPALDGGCPRDYAALMLYNALDAQMVTFDDGSFKDITSGNKDVTIGSKYLGLQTETGILLSAGDASIDGGTHDDKIVRLKDSAVGQFEFETQPDLLGQEVTIVYRQADKVYDLYATDKNNVHDVLKSDVTVNSSDKSKIKFEGYSLTDNEGMLIQTNLTGAAAKQNADGDDDFSSIFTNRDGGSVRFIDNNNDGKFEYALITDKTFSKVSAVSSKGITITGVGSGEIANENIITKDELAKNDYVFCYKTGADKYVIEKATPIQAKIDGTRSNDEIYANGTFYKKSSVAPVANIGLDVAANSSSMGIGNVYDIFVYGNCWIGAKSVETISDNYALMLGQSGSVDGVTELQVRLLLADNTKKSYPVNSDKTDASLINEEGTLKGTNGVTVYAYNINEDGTITLEPVSAAGNLKVSNSPATADGAAKYLKEEKRVQIDGEQFFIDENTVIFAKYEATDSATEPKYSYKAIKGSDLVANLSFKAGENLTAPVAYQYAFTTASGVNTLNMVILDLGTNELSMSTGTSFAFSTSGEYIITENGRHNAVYTIWNGEEEVEIQAKDVTSSASQVDFENKFIKYNINAEENVEKRITETVTPNTTIADASADNLTKASVRGFDGSKWIKFAESGDKNGKYFEITNDTVIHYINMAENEGVSNGSIEVLDDNTAMNAMFSLDDDGKVAFLFIATEGQF